MNCPKCSKETRVVGIIRWKEPTIFRCEECNEKLVVQVLLPFSDDPPTTPGPWWYRETPISLAYIVTIEEGFKELPKGQWSGPLEPPV